MTVRAVKPIEVGEEVTISYVTFWPLLNYCGTMKMFATAQARQDGVSVHRWASSSSPWEGVHFFFRQRGVDFFKTGGGQGGGPLEKKNSLEFLKSAIREGKTAPKIDITNLLQKCNVFFTKL